MITANYLSDVDVLYLDEAHPEIKNNYHYMRNLVRAAIDNNFGVFWQNNGVIEVLLYEAHNSCSVCSLSDALVHAMSYL